MASPRRYRNIALALSATFIIAQAWICAAPLAGTHDSSSSFLGFRHLPTDHFAYMMYSTQTARDGSLLTKNLFTTARQDGRFLMVGLVIAGAVRGITGLPDPVVWHGLRLLVLAAFCLVLWKLVQAVFKEGRKAVAAHAFVLFAGGLDWLVRPFFRDRMASTGLDWVNFIDNPWNFSVFWASTNLVWAIPMTLITLMILLEIRWLEQAAVKNADRSAELARIRAQTGDHRVGSMDTVSKPADFLPGVVRGMVFAALWFIHPYSAIVWGLLVAVAVVVPPMGTSLKRSLFINLPALAGPALVAVFITWSQQDPVVAASNAQTGLWKLGYPPIIYPIVYGPWMLLPLGLVMRRNTIDRHVMRWLLLWFVTGFAMMANPFVTGVKFQFSFLVPFLILQIAGLFALVQRRQAAGGRTSWPGGAIAAFVVLASLNSAAGLVLDVNPTATRTAARAGKDHLALLKELETLPDGGVLCDPFDAQIVPWKAGKPVFVGQWFLSTRYQEKAALVRWFYSDEPDEARTAGFLNNAGIRWILYGPREMQLGKMPRADGLRLVRQIAGRQIWEWAPAGGEWPSILQQSK
ncbi:MAG TPA: hypothetical protein PLB35_08780 [Myxococcota bacterium]|nr:hypothetical protein [Myxococcota bacterium]HOH77338.1 hypothetical protein [Myxococcota bacterium]